jgi:hypothetical protein
MPKVEVREEDAGGVIGIEARTRGRVAAGTGDMPRSALLCSARLAPNDDACHTPARHRGASDVKLFMTGPAGELVAKVDRRGDTPPEYLSRQFRGFLAAGIILPVRRRGHGRHYRALLDVERLCLAYLASMLTRIGVQPPHLKAAMASIRGPYGELDACGAEVPPEYHGGLPTALVEGIRRGERWFFYCWIEPLAAELAGIGLVTAGFRKDEPDIHDEEMQGVPCIVINVTRLFSPLLNDPEVSGDADGKPEPAEPGG